MEILYDNTIRKRLHGLLGTDASLIILGGEVLQSECQNSLPGVQSAEGREAFLSAPQRGVPKFVIHGCGTPRRRTASQHG